MSFNVRVLGPDGSVNGNGLVNLVQVATEGARLFNITGFNTGPDQYIQLFDTAATPTVEKPRFTIKVPADSHFNIDFPTGRKFPTGIFMGNSSTVATYTAGAADCLLDGEFRKET